MEAGGGLLEKAKDLLGAKKTGGATTDPAATAKDEPSGDPTD